MLKMHGLLFLTLLLTVSNGPGQVECIPNGVQSTDTRDLAEGGKVVLERMKELILELNDLKETVGSLQKEQKSLKETELKKKSAEDKEDQLNKTMSEVMERLLSLEMDFIRLDELAVDAEPKSPVVHRTCLDHFKHGSTSDGLYLIDPDGLSFGEPPISVYCSNGVTYVPHDSENMTEIDHCDQSGCFRKNVSYNTITMKQLATLIAISEECQQGIEFGCLLAPLEDDGQSFGKWLDRHGQSQIYYNSQGPGSHECLCSLNNTCLNNKKCNCDAQVPFWSSDIGIITNHTALPITGFEYGPLRYSMQKANITIGRLQCQGQRQPKTKITSCRELFLLASGSTGYQWVWDEEMNGLKAVFCNFNKDPDDPEFETAVDHNLDKKNLSADVCGPCNGNFSRFKTTLHLSQECREAVLLKLMEVKDHKYYRFLQDYDDYGYVCGITNRHESCHYYSRYRLSELVEKVACADREH